MKRYIMIGAPVTSVRTPPMLKDFLADRGVDAGIETRHVATADIERFMNDASSDKTIDGLLVTMPHKKAVMPYLSAMSDMASAAGSVNTIKRLKSGDLVGAQFDGAALVNALQTKGVPLATARILLAGVGGAGLAIAQAIVAHGCQRLNLVDTDSDRLHAVIKRLGAQGDVAVSALSGEHRDTFDLLINATPLGMLDDDPSPFDADLVASAQWVADIVSDPLQTRLAEIAKERGTELITGRDMVIGQVALIGQWLLSPNTEQ